MSGIEELKKKAKYSLDEMFQPQPSMESKVEHKSQIEANPNKDERVGNMETQKVDFPDKNIVFSQKALSKKENNYNLKSEQALMPQLQGQVKMTFALTPELAKGFNDLYALCILHGRKTEKSHLICEAVELLLAKYSKHFR